MSTEIESPPTPEAKPKQPFYADRVFQLCVAAVAGATFMHFLKQLQVQPPKAPETKQAVAAAKPAPPQEKAEVKQPEPKSEEKPKAEEKKPTDQAVAPKTEAKPDAAQKPTATDGGSKAPATPVMPMPGELPKGGLEGAIQPLPPVAIKPEPKRNDEGGEGAPSGFLATGSYSGSLGNLQTLAKKYGGFVRKYQEYQGKGRTVEGYLASVPSMNGMSFLEGLKGLGGVDVNDEWHGSVGGRQQKVDHATKMALSRLQKERADLIVRYYEYAPAVQEVDDEIASANKCLETLHAPGGTMAVFKLETG